MSLADRIKIKTCYTRSTNVERDSGAVATISAYHPTTRGVALLEDVADALGKDNQPRAWSLIGPYGSGKSTFGVFLHALLGGNDCAATEAAKVLGKQSLGLTNRFRRQKPWCRVVLTGSPEPLSRRLLTALDAAASEFWQGRAGRKPRVLDDIHHATQQREVSESHILALIDALQDALERISAGGLLFVVDELGKFLEFEVRQPTGHMGSTYLLQELAERTYLGRKTNLMLFVLQHQTFDMYAPGMGELQNEWAKVQGRFQTVSFIETTEQTLRVLSMAFDHDLTEIEENAIRARSIDCATQLADANALPLGLDADTAAELFTACYPMHPVALLALPVLCVRFAQNERTLFTYFGSNEPHGFRQAANRLERFGDRVPPSEVYDYFVETHSPAFATPLAQRTWAEVVTAVGRAAREVLACANGKGRQEEVNIVALVKTVGLLNLTIGNDAVPAAEAVLGQLDTTKDLLKEAIATSVSASILKYRKFADEYHVWQGTDFNIDEQVAVERDKLGRIDLAHVMTERGETAPIVARRHSIESGALRSFEVVYADAERSEPNEGSGGNPRIVFFLAENRDCEAAFHKAREHAQVGEVWVLHPNGSMLRATTIQVLALERVLSSSQEVASDPIAAREVKERLKNARAVEQQALSALFREPAESQWYWKGKQLDIADRRSLQTALSDIMDRTYADSPKVRNELINRDRLSSQAAAARNKLFDHMLDRADQPGFGITKYPPERAIYRSVLEYGGLHAKDESGQWALAPPPEADPLNLAPTWKRLDGLFEASEAEPVSAEQLMDNLAARPIGLKRGLFPLIFLHYYLLNRREIAFYDEGAYSPVLTYEHLERLVRRPDLFTFQRFRVAGVRATLMEEYAQALFREERDSPAVLDVAQPLASFLVQLPEYTQKTRRLSPTALRVRQALTLAKSPQKLLFEHLPEACGRQEPGRTASFSETLIVALRELGGAYKGMVDEMRAALCIGFGCSEDTSIGDLRSIAIGRCHGLEDYTVDVRGLKSFMRRAVDRGKSDEDWLDGVLTFLGQKPPAKWTDQDRSTADYRLAEFAVRLKDLQRLKLYYDGRDANDAESLDVILLKTHSKAHGEIDETVPIDGHVADAIAAERDEVAAIISRFSDERLRLALVAAIAEDHLVRHRKPNTERGRHDLRRVG